MFWTDMLHCRGGYLDIGHPDDLERRTGGPLSGAIPGFARDHAPGELVWSETIPTRGEAIAAERRLKGWSRAKKLALIRNDWALIAALAKNKGSPSTSSGRTDDGGLSVRPEPADARPSSCSDTARG